MLISPFTMDQNFTQLALIGVALEKMSKIIGQNVKDGDELDGIDITISCLADSVMNMATKFEELKHWAEDANISIQHDRLHGKETRLEVCKYKLDGPEINMGITT